MHGCQGVFAVVADQELHARPGRWANERFRLSVGLLVERLGDKTPSLYEHVTSQAVLAKARTDGQAFLSNRLS